MRITDVLQRVERERDEARAALATMTRQRDDALQVLGQAREALPSDMRDGWLVDAVRRLVRERDEARAALATWQGSAEQERARCVAAIRAAAESYGGESAIGGRPLHEVADRIERGEHAGAPVQEPLPRATDEELATVAVAAWPSKPGCRYDASIADDLRDLRGVALAVAARVRREQCLVTRAVEAGCDVAFEFYSRGVDASVPRADVSVSRPRVGSDGGEFFEGDLVERSQNNISPADVPKTLARLLGEVTRGR